MRAARTKGEGLEIFSSVYASTKMEPVEILLPAALWLHGMAPWRFKSSNPDSDNLTFRFERREQGTKGNS